MARVLIARPKRFAVALHLFFEDKRAPGHGHTDSARYTVEANSDLEAVVLATALATEGMPEGYRIANAHPSVREVSA